MEKLLHERLRDGADMGEQTFSAEELLGFADEIERCYHPKPVDRGGKPWNLGDGCITAEGEEATIVGYRPNGKVFIDLHDEREFARCYASDLKRPAPKVLDADGTEINVDDTVWLALEHRDKADKPGCALRGFGAFEKMKVTETNGSGRFSLRVISEGGVTGFAHPEWVTHRKPDSQQSIDADSKLSGKAYCQKHNLIPHEASGGKSTKYKHLFRRQRALIERGA